MTNDPRLQKTLPLKNLENHKPFFSLFVEYPVPRFLEITEMTYSERTRVRRELRAAFISALRSAEKKTPQQEITLPNGSSINFGMLASWMESSRRKLKFTPGKAGPGKDSTVLADEDMQRL